MILRANSSAAGNGKIPFLQAPRMLAGLRSAEKATGPPVACGAISNESQSGQQLTGMGQSQRHRLSGPGRIRRPAGIPQVSRDDKTVNVQVEKFVVDGRENDAAAA